MTQPIADQPAPDSGPPARLPPFWFVRVAWVVHRIIDRVTGSGLRLPKPGHFGTTGSRPG
jgi:hypothetical protein